MSIYRSSFKKVVTGLFLFGFLACLIAAELPPLIPREVLFGNPVKYIVYTDEGHGFVRPENQLDFFGYVDEFLSKYLGGRVEPHKEIKGTTGEER